MTSFAIPMKALEMDYWTSGVRMGSGGGRLQSGHNPAETRPMRVASRIDEC